MIGRLAGRLEDCDFAAGKATGPFDRFEEFSGVDVSRTGTANDDATLPNETDPGTGEICVSVQAGSTVCGAFRKGGRIQDDKIILFGAALLEPFEHVSLDQPMGAIRSGFRVERKVSARAFKGVRTEIDIGDTAGAGAGGVKGKAAGKTEGIQHILARGKASNKASILALIEEEAGLLTFENIGLETQARFKKNDRILGRRANQHGRIADSDLRGRGLNVAAQTQNETIGTKLFVDERDHLIEARKPDSGIKLENKCFGILIEDKAWKLITFAIDPAEGVGFRIQNSGAPTAREVETLAPPILVHQRRLSAVNDADTNGRIGIKKAKCQKFVLPVKNDREFADGSVAALFTDTVRENPRMPGANLRFSGGTKTEVKGLTFQAENWRRRTEWPGACR